MLHRFIFDLRAVRSAQQEHAVAPELVRHSALLFLNAIRVVVHSPSIVSFMVSSGQEALINAEQFIRVFPTWRKGIIKKDISAIIMAQGGLIGRVSLIYGHLSSS